MWEELNKIVKECVLARFLATIFLFILLMSALVVIMIQMIKGAEISQVAVGIVGAGIGYALHLTGINQGVNLTPNAETLGITTELKKDGVTAEVTKIPLS